MQGPFLLCIFKTDSSLDSESRYDYQGSILVEEGEIARVYRDSLEDRYVDALFTDDTILLMDVRDKKTKERFAVQIGGEPTLAYCGSGKYRSCFDFEKNDDENHTQQKAIQDMTNRAAGEYGIPLEDAYAVIQLNC